MGFRQQVLQLVRRVVGTQMIADLLRDKRHLSLGGDADALAYQELWRTAAAEVIELRRHVAEFEQDGVLASGQGDADALAYQELWRTAAAEVIELRRHVAELERDRELASGLYQRLDRHEAMAREAAE